MNIAESTLTCLVGAIDTMTPTEISEALKTCHDFLLMDKRAQHHTDITGWILKAGYCPVRAGRNYERKKSPHGAKSFNCR